MSFRFLTLATTWMMVSFPKMGNPGEVGGKTRTVVTAVLSLGGAVRRQMGG